MARQVSHRSLVVAKALDLQLLCHILFTLTALSLLILLSGCSKRYDDMPAFLPVPLEFGEGKNESVGRFKTAYLADQIDHYYRGANPGPLGVTTFVNLDDLYNTSSFGRMVGEQLMSELSMRGFDVVELRHADALQFMDSGGEFALSRDTGVVRRERQLGGVIVGTYVSSPERVYLNARLLDPTNSMILSAASAEMSKTSEIARLLRGGGFATSLERIPVRHLGFQTYPMMGVPNQMGRAYDLEESPSAWNQPHPNGGAAVEAQIPEDKEPAAKKGEKAEIVEKVEIAK